jgi:hypothetical protein
MSNDGNSAATKSIKGNQHGLSARVLAAHQVHSRRPQYQ